MSKGIFQMSVWVCKQDGCGWEGTDPEDDEDYLRCPECGSIVKVSENSPRPAKFVSIAIYEVVRAYAGPEEGGRYYDQKYISYDHVEKLRVFTDLEEASAYYDELQNGLEFGSGWGLPTNPDPKRRLRTSDDWNYQVCSFNEKLPPKRSPNGPPPYR